MLNKQIVQGRLTHDPELRATSSGISVCRFSIASQDDVVSSDGTKETDYVECIAWRQLAVLISNHLQKGNMILVEGRPKTWRYTDKNGAERTVTELRVDRFYFCDSKKKDDSANAVIIYEDMIYTEGAN